MAFDSRGNGGTIAQINVTPLVDVMLVLLVIFMVTAPIIQQGVTRRPAEDARGGAQLGRKSPWWSAWRRTATSI